jgi:hypothetical protein
MIIEHSSGGNSTKVLLTSEKEKHRIKMRLHVISVSTVITEVTISSVPLWIPNVYMILTKEILRNRKKKKLKLKPLSFACLRP